MRQVHDDPAETAPSRVQRSESRLESRRWLLEWLAKSPLLALTALGGLSAHAQSGRVQGAADSLSPFLDGHDLTASPQNAINVFDFEPVMRKNVGPAHFGYMATGIDDEVTLRANREGFLRFQLRPRRLVDVSRVDMTTTLLGQRYDNPIIISPVGGLRAYHSAGEEAVARAAKAGNHLMILSNQSNASPEEVIAARGEPIWFQLYATNKWEVTKAFLARAERAGCLAVAVTVDRNGGRNQETLFRLERTDTRDCSVCHDRSSLQATYKNRAMYQGVDLSGLSNIQSSALTWDTIARIRDTTKMKVVLKGILAHEDAELAVKAGVDAIIVSNHGGRSEDNGRSTIEALPEIIGQVRGRLPVLVDSGFRRGTDIVKALCMGASGVCIGRPYVWGLGAFGQSGVERVLELLRIELAAIMQQLGAPTTKQLVSGMVHKA